MKTSERFKEYIWLIDLLKTYGRITFEEINEEWVQTEMSGGVEMARSTFNRHKDAIEDMFGVYIECDRSNGYMYYIGNERSWKKIPYRHGCCPLSVLATRYMKTNRCMGACCLKVRQRTIACLMI